MSSKKSKRESSSSSSHKSRDKEREKEKEKEPRKEHAKDTKRKRSEDDLSKKRPKEDLDPVEESHVEEHLPPSKQEYVTQYVAEDDDEENVPKFNFSKPSKVIDERSHSCPYLDTINRAVLDFDFEKLCSISMSNMNVYACLVCGKYYQGRGKSTHAYTHSLTYDHHVFINLSTLKFYCLPDDYEILDSSLDDIKFVLSPSFTPEVLRTLDASAKVSRALDGTTYLPGIVGLNNIKANDYVNVVFQALARVLPFRNYFLEPSNYAANTDPLVHAVGDLVRKINNPRNFKNHVSPHEFLQAVTQASKKQFRLTSQSDAIDFLSWFLNALHERLKVGKRSIISDTFRGNLKQYSRVLPPTEEEQRLSSITVDPDDPYYKETCAETPFMFLSLDVPKPPLFQDEVERNIIPQVPLFELLDKFNGIAEKEIKTYKETIVKRFEITSFPPYLILCIRRFTKNQFFVEKNPTIVNFPVKNIVLKDYLKPAEGEEIRSEYKYDLVDNVVHDGTHDAGTYRCHLFHAGAKQWFDVQDLHVSEILPQMITLSESYIQIWEQQKDEQ